jgi:hypothetical protein
MNTFEEKRINTREAVDNKEKIKNELNSFFETTNLTEQEKEEKSKNFIFLLENDPVSAEKILYSTKDSREVMCDLRDRASNNLSKIGVDLKWIKDLYSGDIGGYTTSLGIDNAKKEAKPDQLTSRDGLKIDVMPEKYNSFRSWNDLHEHLLIGNRFEGLNEEQIKTIIESEHDLEDASFIRREVEFQLSMMALDKKIDIEYKKLKENVEISSSVVNKVFDPLLNIVNEASYKNRLNRSYLYGKLQKIRFAPKFIGDKIDEILSKLKE